MFVNYASKVFFAQTALNTTWDNDTEKSILNDIVNLEFHSSSSDWF